MKFYLFSFFIFSLSIFSQTKIQADSLTQNDLSIQKKCKELGLKTISKNFIKSQLEFLASDWMEGREMGSKGAYLASDYIQTQFASYGLKPVGDAIDKTPNRYEKLLGEQEKHLKNSFFQNFSVIKYKPQKNQKFKITLVEKGLKKELDLKYKTDFFFTPSETNLKFTTDFVFVGYGLQHKSLMYNDFKNIKVKGKIIIRLKGYPGHKDTTSTAYKAFRWMDLKKIKKSKNTIAKKLGVAGIIEIDLEKNTHLNWASNLPFRQNLPMYEGDKPIKWNYNNSYYLPQKHLETKPLHIEISNRILNTLLKSNHINLKDFEQKAAENLTAISSKKLENIKVSIETKSKSTRLAVRNVLGMIEGENTNETIVVGAHYDHLGKYQGYIWNGADDNASGTVGILAIARACMATGIKPKKNILFATWTGEERGLMGSRYFLTQYPHEKIKIAMNYDMISRDSYWDKKGNKCSMIYTKAFPKLKKLQKITIKLQN